MGLCFLPFLVLNMLSWWKRKKKTEFIKVLKTVPIAKSNLMTLNFDSTMMVVSNIQVIK